MPATTWELPSSPPLRALRATVCSAQQAGAAALLLNLLGVGCEVLTTPTHGHRVEWMLQAIVPVPPHHLLTAASPDPSDDDPARVLLLDVLTAVAPAGSPPPVIGAPRPIKPYALRAAAAMLAQTALLRAGWVPSASFWTFAGTATHNGGGGGGVQPGDAISLRISEPSDDDDFPSIYSADESDSAERRSVVRLSISLQARATRVVPLDLRELTASTGMPLPLNSTAQSLPTRLAARGFGGDGSPPLLRHGPDLISCPPLACFALPSLTPVVLLLAPLDAAAAAFMTRMEAENDARYGGGWGRGGGAKLGVVGVGGGGRGGRRGGAGRRLGGGGPQPLCRTGDAVEAVRSALLLPGGVWAALTEREQQHLPPPPSTTTAAAHTVGGGVGGGGGGFRGPVPASSGGSSQLYARVAVVDTDGSGPRALLLSSQFGGGSGGGADDDDGCGGESDAAVAAGPSFVIPISALLRGVVPLRHASKVRRNAIVGGVIAVLESQARMATQLDAARRRLPFLLAAMGVRTGPSASASAPSLTSLVEEVAAGGNGRAEGDGYQLLLRRVQSSALAVTAAVAVHGVADKGAAAGSGAGVHETILLSAVNTSGTSATVCCLDDEDVGSALHTPAPKLARPSSAASAASASSSSLPASTMHELHHATVLFSRGTAVAREMKAAAAKASSAMSKDASTSMAVSFSAYPRSTATSSSSSASSSSFFTGGSGSSGGVRSGGFVALLGHCSQTGGRGWGRQHAGRWWRRAGVQASAATGSGSGRPPPRCDSLLCYSPVVHLYCYCCRRHHITCGPSPRAASCGGRHCGVCSKGRRPRSGCEATSSRIICVGSAGSKWISFLRPVPCGVGGCFLCCFLCWTCRCCGNGHHICQGTSECVHRRFYCCFCCCCGGFSAAAAAVSDWDFWGSDG